MGYTQLSFEWAVDHLGPQASILMWSGRTPAPPPNNIEEWGFAAYMTDAIPVRSGMKQLSVLSRFNYINWSNSDAHDITNKQVNK